MYQYNFSKSSTGAPFITLDQIEVLTENILNKYCPSAIENFEAVDIEGLAEFDLGFNVEYAYLSHDKHIKDETYLFDFIMKVSEQFQVSKTAALVRLKVLGYAPNNFELTKELYNEFSF